MSAAAGSSRTAAGVRLEATIRPRTSPDPAENFTTLQTGTCGPSNSLPSDPSHIILDIKAPMMSLLMQSACPIELLATELFGGDADAAEDQLTGIRAWRDALGQTDAGRAWLELYRQLHPTLLERIAGDEGPQR